MPQIVGGISGPEEEAELHEINVWVAEQGLKPGEVSYDFADEWTGRQLAVFVLVWLNGLQEELTEPVAVLLNEDEAILALASEADFRCFSSPDSFRRYVIDEILRKPAEGHTAETVEV
ncbi:MAG: hypothetical protein ACQEUZ_03810 [Pseudomonadota bacterium]